MTFIITGEQKKFPPVELADYDGLLAIGGRLTFDRLSDAYKHGIFPWYNETEPVCWYCPDPRFVLFPEKIKVSQSMKKVLKSAAFEFSVDQAFPDVVKNCRMVKRKHNGGTWITDEIERAYNMLFDKGMAHSAEAWRNQTLAGGVYGVQIGKVFFGESMFSLQNNASKFAFINYVKKLEREGIELIDCQVYTSHLQSLGAEFISRAAFTKLLKKLIG